MQFKNFLTSLTLAFVFIVFTPNGVLAQACEDIGAACRPGWISGCGAGENPIFTHSCPFNPSGVLVCCQMAQGVNDCTNAGGLCRSDLYTFVPGEPACGYNGDVQSTDSCGSPAQICCLPPPNIGAPCASGNGTCQLPAACVGGGAANAACFGGAVCCQPILDFFNVPANCSIPTGGNSCSVTISWSISNPLNPSITHDGSPLSVAPSSPGTVVVMSYGLNTFELADGPLYSMRPSNAQCSGSDVWDGSQCGPPAPIIGSVCRSADSGNLGTCGFACAPPLATETVDPTYLPATCGGGSTFCCVSYAPPGGPTLTVPLGCTIPVGQSTCDITISWDVPSPVNPRVEQDSGLISLAPSSLGTVVTLDYSTTSIFDLWNNGAIVKSAASDGDCIVGSSWDGSICAAAAGPTFNVPLGCSIPVGQSTCDISINWNIPAPVNPRVEQDGGLISLAPSSPGTTVTLTYGTTSLFDLWNNGAIIDTAPSDPSCIAGSSWDGSICAAAAGLTCASQSGTCEPICNLAVSFSTASSDCAPQECCVPIPPGPTCVSQGGICEPACNLAVSYFTASSDCTAPAGDCCVPMGPPPPPPVPVSPITVKYPNPLFTGDLQTLIATFLTELQKLIAILAIIFIVIGAFLYITSAGDTGRVEMGKKCILGALIGLALGIAAPMFFREIGVMLGWIAPVGIPAGPSLLQMTLGVVNFMLSVIGVIALIMLVVGAFMYLTAAGDESRIDTGKNIVKYSIIGIAVSLSAIVLIRLVVGFF